MRPNEIAEALAEDLSTLDDKLDKIITMCPILLEAKEMVRKIHMLNDPVLIQGETGTGKELFAEALHYGRMGNFVAVNCAEGPDTLIESILFGAMKGSYTGCTDNRIGLIEEAEGGTLFLDEIGEMPLGVQAKLLRFLNDKTFTPIGSTKKKIAKVRVVCATNRKRIWDCPQIFRQDLYYRISTFKINLPNLKERPASDIELLISKFSRLPAEDRSKLLHRMLSLREQEDKEFLQGNIRSVLNMITLTNTIGLIL